MYRHGRLEPTPWSWWRGVVDGWRWYGETARCVLLIVLGVVMGPAYVACSQGALQLQAHTASGVATAANAALPILIDRYRQEGIDLILAVKARGGDEYEARDAIEGLKDRWAPVWDAWNALAATQNGWATALEGGGDPAAALAGMKYAYCDLMANWPSDVPAVPLAPFSCGAEP